MMSEPEVTSPENESEFVGRLGGIITQITNKRVQVLGDVNPDDLDIEDIAHALSNLCRFGGHTREFYSVAEHSVRCFWYVKEKLGWDKSSPVMQDKIVVRQALMHDASEGYLVDVPRPIKRSPGFEGYLAAEANLEAAIAKKFGLFDEMHPLVKEADLVLLVTEKRDLFNENPDAQLYWPKGVLPLNEVIVPWFCDRAHEEFIRAAREVGLFPSR